jgi:hypothetical protein
MALLNKPYFISSIDEFAEYVGDVAISEDIKALQPEILDVQTREIKPLLGAYYPIFLALYNDGAGVAAMTEKHKTLLFFLQKAVCNLAVAQWVPSTNVKIGTGGMTEAEDANFKAAKQWRVDDYQQQKFITGYRALDEMLQYLEAEKATFTQWAGDATAYTINKQFIVMNAAFFQHWHDIQDSRRTFVALWPIMRNLEQFHIKAAIGTALFTRIKNEIKANSLPSAHIQEILPDLQAAIVKFTIAKAAEMQSISVNHNGLFFRRYASGSGNSREKLKADEAALQRLSNACIEDGQLALQSVINHLNANASAEKFPEWFTSGMYTAPPEGGPVKAYLANKDDKLFMA